MDWFLPLTPPRSMYQLLLAQTLTTLPPLIKETPVTNFFTKYEYHDDLITMLDDTVARLGGSVTVSAANPDHLITARQIVDAVVAGNGGGGAEGGDDHASFRFIWNHVTVTRTVEEGSVFDILSFTVEVDGVSETVTVAGTGDIRTVVAAVLYMIGLLHPDYDG